MRYAKCLCGSERYDMRPARVKYGVERYGRSGARSAGSAGVWARGPGSMRAGAGGGTTRTDLLRQPHPPKQVGIAGIGTNVVQHRLDL
jgi:hypothetical protein